MAESAVLKTAGNDIKISVIVPVFNVEEYLRECLKSLQEQDIEEFEALLIDDGSTDGSPEIAKEFARRDPRFIYVQSDNCGPGAARNTAISRARGEYLCFLDADDIIPRHAYSRMLEEAEDHNADIVTGNVMRLRDGVLGTARLFEIVFSRYRHVTDIHKSPILIYDSISCNKMIRRSFWQENGITYPEGITFEDIPVTFKAYCCARKVIMLDEIVYYWRVRDGATQSITQQKTLTIVNDRLNALGIVNRYCKEHAVEDSIISAWKYKNLTIDLNVLINKAVDFDDEQLEESIEVIRKHIIENGLENEFKRLPLLYYEKYKAIVNDDMEKLRELRRFQLDPASSIRTMRAGGKILGVFPRKVLSYRIADMSATLEAELLRQKATKVVNTGDNLKITGCAYMRYLPVRKPGDVTMNAWLIDRDRNKARNVSLRQHDTATPFGIEKKKNSNRVAYRGTGYTIEISPGDFNGLKPGRYKVLIEWQACGRRREATVSELDRKEFCRAADRWNSRSERVLLSVTEKREPVFTVSDRADQR